MVKWSDCLVCPYSSTCKMKHKVKRLFDACVATWHTNTPEYIDDYIAERILFHGGQGVITDFERKMLRYIGSAKYSFKPTVLFEDRYGARVLIRRHFMDSRKVVLHAPRPVELSRRDVEVLAERLNDLALDMSALFTASRLRVHFSSMRLDYSTPQEVFDQLNAEFHFTLDPYATPENAKCEKYFTPEDDGLKQSWFGRVFMNPPYGREIGKWMEKAYEECKVKGNCELVVCLIPSRTDTRWWHDYVMKADEIRFIKGRLKFDGKNSAPFPSCIVIFRRSENVH